MTPELQTQLSIILETLNNLVLNGTSFVVEKSPIILQQLLAYELIFAYTMVIIGILTITIGVALFFVDEFVSLFFVLFGIFLTFSYGFVVYKITYMPELWLFEYLQLLVKLQ
jgi:hypothetical protein